MRILTILMVACAMTMGCASAQEATEVEKTSTDRKSFSARPHADHRPFEAERDAMADVDAAISRAAENGKKTLIVMGANWCHDSRGLAERLDRPEFQTLIANHFELVYVSAGTKPRQNNQNRAVSKRFGVDKIEGTPTVFITESDGTVLNPDSLGYWRHAHEIPVDMSFAYFDYYARQ